MIINGIDVNGGSWAFDFFDLTGRKHHMEYEDELQVVLGKEIDLRNKAYAERNMCVALIARLSEMLGYKVGMKRHEGEDWEDDWRHVIFIDLPNGQLSWHIHDSEL